MNTFDQVLFAPFVLAILAGLLVVCSLWLYGVSRDRLVPGVHAFAPRTAKPGQQAARRHQA